MLAPSSAFLVPAVLAIVVYIICQTISDFRRKSYWWAAVGAVCVILLACLPITPQKHEITVDLPAP